MIVIYHNGDDVLELSGADNNLDSNYLETSVSEFIFKIAKENPNDILVWCDIKLREYLNDSIIEKMFFHNNFMFSYNTSSTNFINSNIGYVEDSPFVNVNTGVKYPTWLMSSDVGAIHLSVLLKFKFLLKYNLSFQLLLNSIGKIGISKGLLCYSNPKMLKRFPEYLELNKKNISNSDLFWFVKSNYKLRWVLLLGVNRFLYERKLSVFSLLKSLFKLSPKGTIELDKIKIKSFNLATMDVVIPTLGRRQFVKNVLDDLVNQTMIPSKVIIVEQIPSDNLNSELEFINQKWPFIIDHTVINELGACNARNIALSKVSSEWVFLADDDIRLDPRFLENSFKFITSYNMRAVSVSCLQINETEKSDVITQSKTFGSGTSLVLSSKLKELQFDTSYEFGYGEDADFGMQLRNSGTDILYLPFVSMLHLKAPTGGFRNNVKREWDDDLIKPKPSPTIMLFKLKHSTNEQLQSYKTTLFLKYYKSQSIRNPVKYYIMMQNAWARSVYWSNKLKNKEIS